MLLNERMQVHDDHGLAFFEYDIKQSSLVVTYTRSDALYKHLIWLAHHVCTQAENE